MNLLNAFVGAFGAKFWPEKTAFHALRGYLKSSGVNMHCIPNVVLKELAKEEVDIARTLSANQGLVSFASELNKRVETDVQIMVSCLELGLENSSRREILKTSTIYWLLVKHGVIKDIENDESPALSAVLQNLKRSQGES